MRDLSRYRRLVVWFSCGAASAVAAKLALDQARGTGIETVLASTQGQPVAHEWMPIETAPKADGYYWCWCPGAPPQSLRHQAIRFKDGEWWTSWPPTHWMPLPDAPQPAAQGGGQREGCETCGGRGIIGWHTGQTPEQFDQHDAPCPDCQPAAFRPEAGAYDYPAAPASGDGVKDILWRIDNEAEQFLDESGMIYLRWLREKIAALSSPTGVDEPPSVAQPMSEATRELLRRAWKVLDVECPNDPMTDALFHALAAQDGGAG